MKIYHYTSIETLALILKNKTLRFSNLESVDDSEEAITDDFGSLGKYFFVSCWTNSAEENIGLWKLYSHNMKGIRIEIDSDQIPFINANKKIVFTNTIENIDNIKEGEAAVLLFLSDETDIESKVINVDYSKKENVTFSYTTKFNRKGLDFKPVVALKNNCWEFQNEVRFVIMASKTSIKSPAGVLDGIVKTKTPIENNYLDLKLTNDFFNNMVIKLGPKCSDAEEFICEALISTYAPSRNISIEKSNLKIRK